MRRQRLRKAVLVTGAVALLLAVPVAVRTSSAYATGGFPGPHLVMVSNAEAQPGIVVQDQGDRRSESHHFHVGITGSFGGDEFEFCLEAEPRTLDGRNGGIVQVWDCIWPPQAATVEFPQWGWQFEPTSVTGLYRIRMGDKCLDADNTYGIRNGDRTQLWDCLGPYQTNQYWWLVANGSEQWDGPQTLAIKNDATGKCLFMNNQPELADYSPALVWDCLNIGDGGIVGEMFTPERISWPGEP
jgi:hypothetical protein